MTIDTSTKLNCPYQVLVIEKGKRNRGQRIWVFADQVIEWFLKDCRLYSSSILHEFCISSATYAYPLDFEDYLGGVQKNATGHVISAQSSLTQIIMEINRTEFRLEELSNDAGLAEEVRLFFCFSAVKGTFIITNRNEFNSLMVKIMWCICFCVSAVVFWLTCM